MSLLVRLAFVALGLAPACGLFASETGSRLVGAGIDVVTRLVQQEIGRHFDELPTSCESENDPKTGKLLLLCTVCYRLAPGEACR